MTDSVIQPVTVYTVKICVKQSHDVVVQQIAGQILSRLPISSGVKHSAKFNIAVSYGPTQEDKFADFCTLTITE